MDISPWITIMNPDGIKNINSSYQFYDQCFVKSYRDVKPIGKLGEEVLYQVFHANSVGGTLCPTGTYFLMKPDALAAAQWAEEEQERKKAQLKEAIKSLLKK